MAFTLADATKLITNPEAIKIANVFLTEYPIAGLLPFEPISGFDKKITIIDGLPTSNPRDFGTDFVKSYGSSSTYTVEWKNYGGAFEIDKALMLGSPAAAQMNVLTQIQAAALKWSKDIFEGAGGTALTGIATYLSSFFPTQVINAGSTASGDLLTTDMLRELISKVAVDPSDTAIFMSEVVKRRLTKLMEANGQIQYGMDQFGASVMKFADLPIYNMREEVSGDDVLSVVEIDGAATNSNTSSVYVVKFGDRGVKAFGPDTGTFEVESVNPGTNMQVSRCELHSGLEVNLKRSAARLRYVKQAVA